MIRYINLLLVVCLASCAAPVKQFITKTTTHTLTLSSTEEAQTFFTWNAERKPMVSAHRGGPYEGFPENAIETFENVLSFTPAIIEFDVELTKDSILILMHDNTLDRTTNGSGKVSDHTWDEIRQLNLKDPAGNLTNYRVPSLIEALVWSRDKTILTVDVKKSVPFERVIKVIEATHTVPNAAVITYNFDDARKVYEINPDLMLSIVIRNSEEIERLEATGIPWSNVIAFTGLSERSPEFNERLHQKGVFTILGVMGNLDKKAIARGDQVYLELVKSGADILATDRPIEVGKILNEEFSIIEDDNRVKE
ncbi:glycerophosphodiester phosphodiesterase family protein [Anditalea andensis]|uniref:Glycerophosphodiester phosphodiesterase n=1 Tax=Anditalea andensis TaxID=1048983 RepID=A0A074KWJ3_9BACT|nr:glycerophosphodiester phosphodiesterase family protein [Anditalea andensis]KEO74351.1 glycerophosphodiester phosphodiesterase [Anditalea andensis]